MGEPDQAAKYFNYSPRNYSTSLNAALDDIVRDLEMERVCWCRVLTATVAVFLIVIYYYLLVWNRPTSNSYHPGLDVKTDNFLSIEMVVVPFLRYNTTEKAILEREEEYKTVLQRNLDHGLVSHIHVLTTDASWTRQRLSDLTNHGKLIVAEVKSIDMTRDPFDYISRNLVGKDVIFASADIYLGHGFDLVNPVVLSQKKIMYALTRQISKQDKCQPVDLCLEKKYIGCHDVFLFHLTEPLSENDFLRDLQFDLVSPGIENIVIWLFHNRLKYCVLNPCAILETFHLHCSGLRNKGGKPRVNIDRSGLAPFTNKMVC